MSILNIFQKNSKYFFNPVYTRQLSSLETTMELLNQRAKTWNLVTISRIGGYIHKPVLREALDLLQYRHSVLNSHIVTHQHNFRNRFYLQTGTTEKIPLRAVINSEEKEWQEVVNQEMNQPIDSGLFIVIHPSANGGFQVFHFVFANVPTIAFVIVVKVLCFHSNF